MPNKNPGQEKINVVAEAMAVCALPVKPRDLDNLDPTALKRIVNALAEKLVIEREHVAALIPAVETLLHHKREIGKQFIEFQTELEKIRQQQRLVRDARAAAGIA
jgi:hypothetical protein